MTGTSSLRFSRLAWILPAVQMGGVVFQAWTSRRDWVSTTCPQRGGSNRRATHCVHVARCAKWQRILHRLAPVPLAAGCIREVKRQLERSSSTSLDSLGLWAL